MPHLHGYLASRPTGFPQVLPLTHNPNQMCTRVTIRTRRSAGDAAVVLGLPCRGGPSQSRFASRLPRMSDVPRNPPEHFTTPRAHLPRKPADAPSAVNATPRTRIPRHDSESGYGFPTGIAMCAGSATTPPAGDRLDVEDVSTALVPGFLSRERRPPRSWLPLLQPVRGRGSRAAQSLYNPKEHYYGMGIQVTNAIGSGSAWRPARPRTTSSRSRISSGPGRALHDLRRPRRPRWTAHGGRNGFPEQTGEGKVLQTFFVPSSAITATTRPACRCARWEPPSRAKTAWSSWTRTTASGAANCIQPARTARATSTPDQDGRQMHVLLPPDHPGASPACVEVCPTQARIFGDTRKQASPLHRLRRMARIQVLKPALNTAPKVYYTNLDGEVR